MDQREFEVLVDLFGTTASQLVDLVEQARYEQPTARAIASLLDARERLLALAARLPALRRVSVPDDLVVPAGRPDAAQIEQASIALRAGPDPATCLALAEQAEAWFAALVAPLQAAGRWPKGRQAR